jgi:hypothetical protein
MSGSGYESSFAYVWNAAFEALPANTELVSLGAQRIRDHKAAFTERFQVCFVLNGTGYDGQVQQLVFYPGQEPNLGASCLFAYTETNGINELYWQDNDGNLLQLTNAGQLNSAAGPIPSGTQMNFLQAAVPVGWTQNTAFNDLMIRLTNGVGGGIGGGWVISGGEVGATQLSQSQLPSNVLVAVGSGGVGALSGGTTVANNNAGGGQAHTHSFTTDGTWRPAYFNSVVGVKN